MQHTISTPRLKLTLIEKAERGSQELAWLHELRSNEQSTWWSQHGQSKTLEDTELALKGILPIVPSPSEGGASEKSYRLVYAVHELLDPTAAQQEGEEEEEEEEEESTPTRFIGLINLRSLDKSSFALPAHLFPPCTLTNPSSILTVELGYLFLPVSWSRGFATESVTAVLRTCRGAPGFWEPYTRVYVRAVVSVENSGSLKVVEKIGMEELGVHEWKGEKAWFAGMWRDRLEFGIWGTWM